MAATCGGVMARRGCRFMASGGATKTRLFRFRLGGIGMENVVELYTREPEPDDNGDLPAETALLVIDMQNTSEQLPPTLDRCGHGPLRSWTRLDRITAGHSRTLHVAIAGLGLEAFARIACHKAMAATGLVAKAAGWNNLCCRGAEP